MKKDTNLECSCIEAYEGNYTKRSKRTIKEITIHHMGGKASRETCGRIFQRKGRNGSTHYGIGYDGLIGQYVNEKNIAWSNSNWDANCRAITIECSNDTIGGDWHISDETLNSLILLVADISKRRKLGKLYYGINLTWHSMYGKTACPGQYLLSKLNYICYKANVINGYEEEGIMRYQKLDDITDSYWKEYAKKLMDKGILKGDENGNIDITIDMLRCIKMMERM